RSDYGIEEDQERSLEKSEIRKKPEGRKSEEYASGSRFGFRISFGFRSSDFGFSTMERLQKFLAEGGVASRRAGEQLILAGRVSVNGRTVCELGSKVDPQHDKVTVDGKPVRPKRRLYIALNKPPGCVCSRKDEMDRPTIYHL